MAESKIGTENYDIQSCYKGKPVGGMAIRLAAGANALETGDRVKAKMAELSKYFPPGMKVVYPYDTTPFVKISIEEVVKTLIEAVFLVFIIMFLFLQNIRATLIPTIAVPVVLLGTMGVLSAAGFSINTLTMFALVIVIGLLVDDAIVVVENVERIMSEEGLSPQEATIKSMGQITSALWGIATVLTAVFVPMAFFRRFHRRHLPPVLHHHHLRHDPLGAGGHDPDPGPLRHPAQAGRKGTYCRASAAGSAGSSAGSTRCSTSAGTKYEGIVGRSFGKPVRYLVVYGAIVAAMVFFFLRLPTAFLPDEDQGFIICQVQLPAGATQERTIKVIDSWSSISWRRRQKRSRRSSPWPASALPVAARTWGWPLSGSRTGTCARRPDLKAPAIAGRAMGAFSKIRDGLAFAFSPPAVLELGVGQRLRLPAAGSWRPGA